MASVSDPFVAHCLEMLRPLGALRSRRMFSGVGVYVDDVFIAILVRENLYLKVDDTTRPDFEAAGGQPFTYDRDGKEGRLNFWTVPTEALESPSLMLPWARLAMAAGLRARNAKPPARKAAVKKVAVKKAPARKAPAKKAAKR